uniref:DnaJ homolog subfamily C member 2 n=1 Tax=Strigamia maritima TaxID=126957 RepID=T1JNI0_STRMM
RKTYWIGCREIAWLPLPLLLSSCCLSILLANNNDSTDMVTILTLPSAAEEDETEVYAKLSAPVIASVEPVGKWFALHHSRKLRHNSSTDNSELSEDNGEESSDVEIEHDIDYLRSLDPKDWKNQDHYAVLGLRFLRNKASDDVIKKAYRKIVLRHHPDKRRNAGENVLDTDDDYFSCITKAFETLGNVAKRRAFDSIDPEFDNAIPSSNNITKESFFELFTDVFDQNSRWSLKQPVPKLGDMSTDMNDVDSFYSFWYNFDSWREFSYLDEEEKEKGENREERRWIEKQNKSARLKRKKEEMTRIRQLVDNAYNSDPRIQKFKDDEKQKKLAYKKARQDAVKAKAAEEEKIRLEALEAERKIKQKEEEEARAQLEANRKAKDIVKKALKKERKALRTLCKEKKYYMKNDSELVKHMAELDKLCELLSLESLESMNKQLVNCDDATGRMHFLKRIADLNKELDKEKEQLFATTQKTSCNNTTTSQKNQWPHDDMQLLIKAVNLFPAGTNERWEVVAGYINQHSVTGITRNAKEVLVKAKELKKLDSTLKDEVNKQAYNKFEKKLQKPVVAVKEESAISERFDCPAEQHGLNLAPWTPEEQRLLEQALKTYPSSTVDRWDRIAESLPGRSKKDCMKRYKDLVEMVRAKKAVQQNAVKTKQ